MTTTKTYSFKWRTIIIHTALLYVVLGVFFLMMLWLIRNNYLQTVEQQMEDDAVILGTLLQHDPELLPITMNTLVETAGFRTTVIQQDGKVMADSVYDPVELENHVDRPEVRAALKGNAYGIVRFSATQQQEAMFVAVPFWQQDQMVIIRVSVAMDALQTVYLQQMISLLILAFLVSLFLFLISRHQADALYEPITEITQTIQAFASGEFDHPLYYNQNNEIGTLVRATNETGMELKQMVREITRMKDQFENLLYYTVNGIILFNEKGRLTYFNPVAAEMLHLTEKAVGKTYQTILPAYDLICLIKQSLEHLALQERECIVFADNDKTLEVNVVPLPSAGGILVVLNDISSLKHMETMRKDLVANVSHELKTPLASISGFAETLQHGKNWSEAEIKEFAGIIYMEATRLNRMITRLLDLSHLESEKEEQPIVLVDLNKLIEDTVRQIQKTSPDPIDIQLETSAPTILFYSVEDYLSQILINLLDNAIKYNLDQAPIQVVLQETAEDIVLQVCDRGIGIPAQEQARIFERFYRVDKTRNRETGGSGLGLTIAKYLVNSLGGDLSVESMPGKGSVFTVRFRLKA